MISIHKSEMNLNNDADDNGAIMKTKTNRHDPTKT